MLARVKQSYPWGIVTAFAGHEYTKREWRPVPAGSEDAAAAHESLEVKNAPAAVEAVEETAVDHDPLADLTVAELRGLAADAGISYSGMKKADLLIALSGATFFDEEE